jgi:hypothetical protein
MLIEILTTSRYEHEAARTEGGGGERRDGKWFASSLIEASSSSKWQVLADSRPTFFFFAFFSKDSLKYQRYI